MDPIFICVTGLLYFFIQCYESTIMILSSCDVRRLASSVYMLPEVRSASASLSLANHLLRAMSFTFHSKIFFNLKVYSNTLIDLSLKPSP